MRDREMKRMLKAIEYYVHYFESGHWTCEIVMECNCFSFLIFKKIKRDRYRERETLLQQICEI